MSNRKSRRKEPPAHIETEYGYIQIEDTTICGEPVRYYRHNGAYSSGTYLREEKKYELFFDYPKKYEEAFRFLEIKNDKYQACMCEINPLPCSPYNYSN